MLDERRRRAAFEARDRSADGLFLAGVMTTGIYCRPSCPARRPRPENVRFYADAESARADGLRACLRCRPDARSEEHTSELQSLMRISYAVFCLKKKHTQNQN